MTRFRFMGGGVPGWTMVPLLALLLLFQGEELVAQDPSGAVFVDSIRVEGNVRQNAGVIMAMAGLQPGTLISFRDIQSGTKSLMASGYFHDIQVLAEGQEGEPVTLVLRVEERDLVRRVSIEGLERIRASEVMDSSGLRGNAPYDPARVAGARTYIRDRLARAGVPFASIEETLRPVPDGEGLVDLILQVREGNRVTVAQVTFDGNAAFSDSDLRKVMSTRPEGFWWFRTGSYDESRLEEDLQGALPDFYASNGYLDFQVLADTLIIDPRSGKSRVEVGVSEGPQYRLGTFTIEGNRRFPTDQLEFYFQTERGGLLRSLGFGGRDEGGTPPFDRVAFEDALRSVNELYNNAGYIYARIEPVLERREPVEGQPPTVDVAWRIEEGNPAYISRVSIIGNEFTHDRVIREQISLLPGDIYSQALLLQSWQAIQALGFFETPMEVPDIQPNDERDVDIIFTVKEKQTGSVNFGTSVGGGTGVAGFLGYEQPNLFGQAKSGNLRWDFGRYSNNFSLTYGDPSLFQSRVSGTFSVFNSRDRFFRFDSGERRRIGASSRFGFPIPGARFTRVFLGYSLSRTRYELNESQDDTSLFGLPPGTQSQLSLGVTRQTLNHPIFPTMGSRLSLNSEFNGGLLGGDGDFIRHLVEGTWYTPVGQLGGGSPGSRPVEFSLGLSARGGAVFGNAERFPFDRFWMGGVQFGQRLRGYDETTVTPLGFVDRGAGVSDVDRLGDAYVLLTAEYAVRFNDNLGLSVFYDAGNLWRSPSEVDPSRLFRGAGVGVQLVTPFGPLGLDYAYGFDKTVPGWQLHFRLGPGF